MNQKIQNIPIKSQILIVDNDLPTIKLIKLYLKKYGIYCRGIATPAEALSQLEIAKPDLILLDYKLPEVISKNFCEIIKSKPKFQHIPIYILTTLPKRIIAMLISPLKADGYILKPFDLKALDPIVNFLNGVKF